MAKFREKISGNTRSLSREFLTIDRTDQAFTKKVHRVEEKGDDGSYHVVHEEEEKNQPNAEKENENLFSF